MTDELPDDIVALAEEYLDIIDSGDTTENVEESRAELKYWEEQVTEFEEGTPMYEMAVEERDKWREEVEAVESQGEYREELRTELLTRASTEFAPQGKWLEPSVVEALSKILIGRRREQLLIDDFRLPRDAEDMTKRDLVSVAKTVHALSLDARGEDDRIAELWDKLNTDTQLSIITVLAGQEEPLSSSEISEGVGEEGTDSPGANIRYLRGEVEIDPYYSTSNGYTLSLAGRYVWMEYGEDFPESQGSEIDESQTESDKDKQETTSENDEAGEETSTDENKSDTKDSDSEMDLSSFEIQE